MIKTSTLLRLYWPPLALSVALVGGTSVAHAQDAVFADDFNQDSLSWKTFSYSDSGPASARGEEGAIVMEVSSSAGGNASRLLRLNEMTSSMAIKASIDPTTSFNDDSSRAFFGFSNRLFNSEADGGVESTSGFLAGDIVIGITAELRGNGNSQISACVNQKNETDLLPQPIYDDGSHCFNLGDLSLSTGTPFTLGYAFDRSTGSLVVSIDDQSESVTLEGPFFDVAFTQAEIKLSAQNQAFAVGRITSISTDSGTTDFAGSTPIVDRYERVYFDSDNPGSAGIVDGRAKLVAVSGDGSYSASKLRPQQSTDYIEAVFTLSSESELAGDRIDARLESEWFNNLQEGGAEGRTGDVRATIEVIARANGARSVQYCLIRSEDADFRDDSGLLDDGENCESFPTLIELDVPYRVSLALDREAATMSYRFEGFSHVQAINGGVFAPSQNSNGDARSSANGGSTAVVFVDDLRTSPSALTPTETAAGITVPAAFPDPVDPATLVAVSTLTAPYDFEQTLSFVDDFSDPESAVLGFWGGARGGRGESGVSYVDGALELAANTNTADGNDSNYSEFYVNGNTDSLRASVSLSSNSALPPDPDAEAEIGLRAIFHNDIQDGGPGGREGDVSVRLLIRQEGDGRMRNGIGTNRRDQNGNNESYDIIDGDDYGEFDFVPALDTIYDLGIEIDRERGVLVVSIDDMSREIALPTEAFEAAQASVNIQVSHRGASGRAVGRIHSIETDAFQRDFADGPGLIGPYAPVFSARNLGQEVTYADGRARLLADTTLSTGDDTRIFAAGGSDYVGATVELSSASTIVAEGAVKIGVGASLYNDFMAGSGSEGRVYAELMLSAEADGTIYAEYCAIRSNDADFEDTVELITGRDDDCARFDLAIALDTPYAISLQLDRERSALVYRVGEETREYAIATQILDIGRPFNAVNLRASDGSIAIGYADDFSLAENPVPLVQSDNLLVKADDTQTGGGSSSSGSGGGCSITSTGTGNASLLVMLLLAIAGLVFRRR